MSVYLKIFCMSILLVLSFANASAAELRAFLEPATVSEGETFVLTVACDGRDTPRLLEAPPQLEYVGSSMNTEIVNGKASVSVGYRFIARTAGKYTIEPLKVSLGSKEFKTPPLTLTVVKASATGSGADEVFLRSEYASSNKEFFVGEEIPLTIAFYYPPQIRAALESYPVLNIGKSVFCDFRQKNPRNNQFDRPVESRKVIDGKLYEEVLFRTAFRPLAPGKLQVSGSLPCQVQIPGKRRQDNFGFFSSTSYRTIKRTLQIKLPEITVKPLPENSSNGIYLNLVGSYSGKAELSQAEVHALEPMSLNIFLSGNGSFETLKAPEIALESCRVYPGEISYRNNGALLSYAIIPLKAGNIPVKLDFCTFDPASAAYKNIRINEILKVSPPLAGTAAAAQTPAKTVRLPQTELAEEPAARTTLLYCKKAPSSAVKQFYRRNRIELAITLLGMAVLWTFVNVLSRKYRQKHAGNADELRRKNAGSRRQSLADKVRRAAAGDLPQLVTGEVADFLCDRWKLPAGTTPEELAKKAYDPALKEVLQECANISYLPTELSGNVLKDAEHSRRVLLKAIKLLLISGILFLQLPLAAAEKSVPANWSEALKSYDRGDYANAHKYFEKYAAENPADANVYYNLGCTAEACDQPEMALYYLECAGLTDPLDSAVHENRNVMRRKFFLPELGKIDHPLALLKALFSRLHPEDYLVLAALMIFVGCVIFSLRRPLKDSWRWGMAAVIVGFAVIFLLAAAALYSDSYRKGQALVVSKNVDLYTFPASGGSKLGSLAGGTPVSIIEERSTHSLVRANGQEGWVENKSIRSLPVR